MSQGIPYADIIIIALIAGFILLRLRNVLGQKGGNDNPQFFQRETPPREERKDTIIQLNERSLKPKPKEEPDRYVAGLTDSSLVEKIQAIKAKDPAFNASQFMDGAKMAFEMVFDAFAKGDTGTLKMLLSDPIYKEFSKEIEAHEKDEIKSETTLVAVVSRDMVDASLDRNTVHITVKFVSEQVTVERNPQGEIVGGDASQTQHVENEWVFERDATSKNPNWKIIET